MAWQLIYTSAPRLLDAGRTGFGTVARHREISPLVVQAVERFSQFARLPGLDPQRLIYTHRSVQSAGVLFHILSRIRSAGSDYTGRTNHIAHHLIVTSREAAACAAAGITPADLIEAFPWRDAWSENARMLGKDEEVDLLALPHSQNRTSGWASITGNPSHAWLLVEGPASRGCCLLVPPGCASLPLLREASTLAPDLAWQTTFTTSLEPTDQASDFGWVGMEASSPLAGELQNSRRPVLNLTQPASLPEPVIPTAAMPDTAVDYAQASPAATESPRRGSQAFAPPPPDLAQSSDAWAALTAKQRESLSAPAKKRSPARMAIVGAALLLLIGLASAFLVMRSNRLAEEAALAQIDAWIGQHADALDASSRKELLLLEEGPRREICDFASKLLGMLRDGPAEPAQLSKVPAPAMAMPVEFEELRDAQKAFAHVIAHDFQAPPMSVLMAGNTPAEFIKATADRGEARLREIRSDHLPDERLKEFLSVLRNTLKEDVILHFLAALEASKAPFQSPSWWKENIDQLKSTPNTAQASTQLEKASSIVAAWMTQEPQAAKEILSRAKSAQLPAWLLVELRSRADALGSMQESAPPPAAPKEVAAPKEEDRRLSFPRGSIYVANTDWLKAKQTIRELSRDVALDIATKDQPTLRRLRGNDAETETTFRMTAVGDVLFIVDYGSQTIARKESASFDWSNITEIRGWNQKTQTEAFCIFLVGRDELSQPLLDNPKQPFTAKIEKSSSGTFKLNTTPVLLPYLKDATVLLQLPDDFRDFLNEKTKIPRQGIEIKMQGANPGELNTEALLAANTSLSPGKTGHEVVTPFPIRDLEWGDASPLYRQVLRPWLKNRQGMPVAPPRSKETNSLPPRTGPSLVPNRTVNSFVMPSAPSESDKAKAAIKEHAFMKEGPRPGIYWLKVSVGGKRSQSFAHLCNIEIKP